MNHISTRSAFIANPKTPIMLKINILVLDILLFFSISSFVFGLFLFSIGAKLNITSIEIINKINPIKGL